MSQTAAFAVADATGRILRVGVCPADDLVLQAGSGETVIAVEAMPGPEQSWINGGAIEPRPMVALPAAHNLAALVEWTVTGVPPGSDVAVDGVSVGTADGSDLVLVFPETGIWHLRLTPPWPWRASECEVTVA